MLHSLRDTSPYKRKTAVCVYYTALSQCSAILYNIQYLLNRSVRAVYFSATVEVYLQLWWLYQDAWDLSYDKQDSSWHMSWIELSIAFKKYNGRCTGLKCLQIWTSFQVVFDIPRFRNIFSIMKTSFSNFFVKILLWSFALAYFLSAWQNCDSSKATTKRVYLPKTFDLKWNIHCLICSIILSNAMKSSWQPVTNSLGKLAICSDHEFVRTHT